MRSPEGIQKFIEYKRSVEKERPFLTVEPNLITIDGIDGAGKSIIARKLAEKLQERFGEDKVILVDITNLRGSQKQERLRHIAKHKHITGPRLDMLYAAGINRAYEEIIIPALNEGKIVIVDRSEVDLLRYAIEHNNKISTEKRKKYIKDGSITHRLWAGNRIFLKVDPKDAWENLENRGYKSQYDPISLEEVKISDKAQQEAEQYIESLPHIGEMKIIKEKITRIESETKRDEYLNTLVEKLITNLHLPKKRNRDE